MPHQEQLVCLQWWGRRFACPRLRAQFFTPSETEAEGAVSSEDEALTIRAKEGLCL
jgi:hypothetical protein